jgi:hypothetical protein
MDAAPEIGAGTGDRFASSAGTHSQRSSRIAIAASGGTSLEARGIAAAAECSPCSYATAPPRITAGPAISSWEEANDPGPPGPGAPMQASNGFQLTTRLRQSSHALANGRWSLPTGYGVTLESYEPPDPTPSRSGARALGRLRMRKPQHNSGRPLG